MSVLILSCLLLLAPPTTDEEYLHFKNRMERTDPQDGNGLLELGQWCDESGHAGWGVACYKKVLRLGARNPHYVEAAHRVARYEIGHGRHESGYALLRELVEEFGDERARALLVEAATHATRKQRDHMSAGDQWVERHKWRNAIKEFEKAYRLAPKGEALADFVPATGILRRIAECRARRDQEFFEKKMRPIEHSITDCTDECTASGGFKKCRPCKGQGRIRRWRIVKRRRVYYTVKCGTCNGHKWLVCDQCGGMQSRPGEISKKEKKALRKVLGKVTNLKTLRKKLRLAIAEIEKTLLRLDDGPSLAYFRSVYPTYSRSAELREALGTIPPEASALRAAGDEWRRLGNEIRNRPNFLLAYTAEFATFLGEYEMFRGERLFDFSSVPNVESPPELRVTPDVLAAFPEENTGEWITVDGLLKSIDTDGERKGVLEVAGDFPHDIHFFFWKPDARRDLLWLRESGWKSQIGDLPDRYPFDLAARVDSLARDTQVVLVGRFLYDRLGHPRNWFEVWDVEEGLDASQKQLFASLREPAEISFPSISLQNIVGFLRWYGLAIEVEGVDANQQLRIEARDCPVGLVLEELTGQLRVDWYVRGEQIVICSRGEAPEFHAKGAVLRRLASINTGEVSAGAPAAVAAKPRPHRKRETSGTPEQLERAAREAISRMDYVQAMFRYEALSEALIGVDTVRGAELETTIARLNLYHAMTGGTSVSRLSQGSEPVTIITFTSPEGELLTRATHVIRRDHEHVWVQPPYGGEFRMPLAWIENEVELTPADYKKRKRRQFQRLERRTRSSTGRERLSALFMAALFAKTHEIPDRGTDLLDRALEDKEFGWLLETYFARKYAQLERYWIAATHIPEPEPRQELVEGIDAADPVPEAPGAEVTDPKQLIAFARQEYAAGRLCLGQALPGLPGAGKQRKKALRHFVNVQHVVDRLLAVAPEHAEARRMSRDVVVMIQTCVKDLGFFD